MIISLGNVASPDAEISARLSEWKTHREKPLCVALCYTIDTMQQSNAIPLAGIYLFDLLPNGSIQILASVTDRVDELTECVRRNNAEFYDICTSMGLSVLNLSAPMCLETVTIPKPWGNEIWFTGSETRGVSSVQDIPLPWVISLYQSALVGQADPELVLLKILDPLPDENYGDLYFEMHSKKTEVYVITRLDETAWPGGKGQIRIGFSKQRQKQYPDLDTFKAAYLTSVQEYERIRRQIDTKFDEYRNEEGYPEDMPLPVDVLDSWRDRLPDEWQRREDMLRTDMNDFTAFRNLSVGDVICIDPLTPHSLQHGVRCIEFQTPHYERQILSFTQKVLTQSNWDTETAIQEMIIAPPIQQPFEIVHQASGVCVEIIADFEQFVVLRATIESDHCFQQQLNDYALIMCVSGNCAVADVNLAPERACLVPHNLGDVTISSRGGHTATCLVALPACSQHG